MTGRFQRFQVNISCSRRELVPTSVVAWRLLCHGTKVVNSLTLESCHVLTGKVRNSLVFMLPMLPV